MRTLFAALSMISLLACDAPATRAVAAPTNVPEALRVPDSAAVLLLRAKAHGAQIYECQKGAAFEWKLVAPEATLEGEDGRAIGTHGAGPTWTLTADGSSVKGAVKEKVPHEGTIPWLLLTATPAGGEGVLAHVRFIQRLDTSGGQSPSSTCDEATAGQRVPSSYTAAYYFWGTP